ncbi:N-acetyl sugar amidotransferase [Candidatus Pelagibacter sp.]|nr:N-acetyl sugar amidotransferase [Candidatus Pelagibacter sp.]
MTKICSNCVMDITDPNISFNSNGVCNHCTNYYDNILPFLKKKIQRKEQLQKSIQAIKNKNKNKEFDCIIGLSGGVDSSYLLHMAVKQFKLRPLVFHVDAGWNSLVAVSNIEKLVDKLNLTLHTNVIYWPEMRDLQYSFFKAQVPHLDTPQDHAFFASTYNYAAKHKINTILNGGNYATEGVREPLDWHYHASDLYHLKNIHSKFGSVKLKQFPLCGIFKYKLFFRFFKNVKVLQPLNYIDYNKQEAISTLSNEYDWEPYSHKHYESRFTKFYEGYWLLKKFGFDKRKAHYSSLILSNQLERSKVIEDLKVDPLDKEEIKKESQFICSKLNISLEELEKIFNGKNKSFRDYKSHFKVINFFTKVFQVLKIEKRVIQ